VKKKKEDACVHFYKGVIEGVWIRIFFFLSSVYVYIFCKISDICCLNDINLKLVSFER
jgi:hypothetical protein